MSRRSLMVLFGVGAAACVTLSLALMLSCGSGYYDDYGYYGHHHNECIDCQTTSECTNAIGAGWVCLNYCCVQFSADDDTAVDDDATSDDDDNDDNDDNDNDASPVGIGVG